LKGGGFLTPIRTKKSGKREGAAPNNEQPLQLVIF